METNTKASADFARRCVEDADYRARVHADPVAAIAEYGFQLADSVSDVRVVENSDDVLYCVIPVDPNESLSDGDLDRVAGGLHAGWRPPGAPVLPPDAAPWTRRLLINTVPMGPAS